jgi:spermidine dehydrogenase
MSGRPAKDGVTRRDLLAGAAFAALTPAAAAAEDRNAPQLTLAGQRLESAALLHSGDFPAAPPFDASGGEHYDLVVVGAGISGLATAWWYRRHAGRPVRILLLDALPQLGGHAIRNEFVARNGRRLIGYGGSQSLDSPSQWSPAARSLLRELDIDLTPFESWYDQGWSARHGLDKSATLFTQEAWGHTQLVLRDKNTPPAALLAQMPIGDAAKRDLLRLWTQATDPFADLAPRAKRARLASISYAQLLREHLGMDAQVLRYLADRSKDYLGAGIDAVNALDAYALGLPGFEAMNLGTAVDPLMSPSARQAMRGSDDYIYHFPDGNAGLVRALLRGLIPAALPGSGAESLVLAARDDAQLDRDGQDVRIRLGTPVFSVRHAGPAGQARAVDIAYQRVADGSVHTVRASHVVLACFHRVIPRICPELPAAQREALMDQVKIPLVYANVLLSDWRAFARAGIAGFSAPGHFWQRASLDFPVSVGRYRFADGPDDPMLLHLSAVVLDGPEGSPEREQAAAGRRKLLAMPFEQLEGGIRSLLRQAMAPFGFDEARQIEAITINRWPHGYAYEYMRPWDRYWPQGPLPIETARRRWGRIAIANADAGAFAYAHGAIDQAARAVKELLPRADLPRWARQPGPAA